MSISMRGIALLAVVLVGAMSGAAQEYPYPGVSLGESSFPGTQAAAGFGTTWDSRSQSTPSSFPVTQAAVGPAPTPPLPNDPAWRPRPEPPLPIMPAAAAAPVPSTAAGGPSTDAPVVVTRNGDPAELLRESTWYAREDYFYWNERFRGASFQREEGLLLTLGYVKRVDNERYRAELFGNTVSSYSDLVYDDGWREPLESKTGYIGARGEYDWLYVPASWPNLNLLLGIGTRFWFRDLRDDVSPSGTEIVGYQETWWTIYPYLGAEVALELAPSCEFYSSGRIGLTPVTYEHVTYNDVTLHPKCGMTGSLEAGVRWPHLFLGLSTEVMSWGESGVARQTLQPASTLFTIGLKSGVRF